MARAADAAEVAQAKARRAAGKVKVRYHCPTCGSVAWGRPELALICGPCFSLRVARLTGLDPEHILDQVDQGRVLMGRTARTDHNSF